MSVMEEIKIIGMGAAAEGTLTGEARDAIAAADVVIGSNRLLDAAKRIRSTADGNVVALDEADVPDVRIGMLGEDFPDEVKRRLVAKSLDGAERPDLICAWKAEAILDAILAHPGERICVLFSGDIGFYSGAAGLGALLKEREIPFSLLPGISSVQLFSAALREPWESWKLVSAHGRAIVPYMEVEQGRDTLFLTGGSWTVEAVCRSLCDAGCGSAGICVGSELGGADEAIFSGTVEEAANRTFPALSVMLVRGTGKADDARDDELPVPFLLPDEAFIRGNVPMTKQEVRAAILLALAPKPDDVIWDIGAGTGSVSVELARHLAGGAVYAVEYNEEAIRLIGENAGRFIRGRWKRENVTEDGQAEALEERRVPVTEKAPLEGTPDERIEMAEEGESAGKEKAARLVVVSGKAPDVCSFLPMPDAVFIGGSSGRLKDILDVVFEKNPNCRVVVSAILTETLSEAAAYFSTADIPYAVTQVAVSRSAEVSGRHMMKADNPVWIVCGGMRG